MLSKQRSKRFIDFLENIILKIPVSKDTIGYLIRSIHYSLPFWFYFTIVFCPHQIVIMSIITIIVVIILFILFNGCFITRLEHRFLKDKHTILDFPLEILGLEKNNQNSIKITYLIFFIYIISITITYYVRFKKF